MSDGLLCLTCRKYIVAKPVHPEWCCQCPKPAPSWDGETLARPSARTAERGWMGLRPGEEP